MITSYVIPLDVQNFDIDIDGVYGAQQQWSKSVDKYVNITYY